MIAYSRKIVIIILYFYIYITVKKSYFLNIQARKTRTGIKKAENTPQEDAQECHLSRDSLRQALNEA